METLWSFIIIVSGSFIPNQPEVAPRGLINGNVETNMEFFYETEESCLEAQQQAIFGIQELFIEGLKNSKSSVSECKISTFTIKQ